MPSPRSRFEAGCRIGAFAVLGWLLGGSLIPAASRRMDLVSSAELAERLPALSRATGNAGLHVTIPSTPDPWVTDWVSALRHSGRLVSWSGSPAPAALSAERIADPSGSVRVDVAAGAGSVVKLRDDASAIDSLRVANLGASIETPVIVGQARAEVAGERMSMPVPDSAATRAVLVIGAAGWEGKYIVSALEERGWPVIARFSIAPNVDVTQGIMQALDTSRVGVVIAIDSTVSTIAPALERYVRSGGGLILSGSAASVVPGLAPGLVDARTRPTSRAIDTVRLGSTGFYPVSRLKDDGVVLERREGGVAVAARRFGAGRVVQTGYDDTWRWRMAGASGAEEAHRAWWSRVVGSVAYQPSVARSTSATMTGTAPVAALVERLGPPRGDRPDVPAKPIDRRILITVMMVLLLTEWASRRLRGLR